MNNDGNHTVSVRDLAEEAKKRIVLLVVCIVGLSYLMSLTSSSVLVNLPAALFLILLIRYMSVDFDTRRKASAYKAKQRSDYCSSERSVFQGLKALKRPDWRFKVNSPVVEDAIEQFGRHIVSEWVTNLWYSRVTPDKQGPEELVLIMNGALGEICSRMRNINLIDLLTRDIINIISTRLELFRASIKKIEKNRNHLTSEELDMKIKSILAAENKLHPILFSAEAEHMVLQCVMDGLILLILQPEDLQCSLFRYITRELLSCVVMRPVLNLANPRFVNQRIESAVIAARKAGKGNNKASTLSSPRLNESSTLLSDQDSQFWDPSIKGVELVQLKKDQDNRTAKNFVLDDMSGTLLSKDPLLSMDTRTTRSWSSLPDDHSGVVKGVQQQDTGGEWGNVLDEFSRRKIEALAPEHFDNMWAKGRNYKGKDGADQLSNPILRDSLVGMSNSVNKPEVRSELMKEKLSTSTSIDKDVFLTRCNKDNEEDSDALHGNFSSHTSKSNSLLKVEDVKSGSSAEAESWTSSNTEDDDTGTVMRLDSPGVKVWDSKNKRNFSHIHHPLETLERHKNRHKGQLHSKILHRRKSAKKRSKSVSHNGNAWQEVERTSFLLGDGQDSLNFSEVNGKLGESSEDSEEELLRKSYAGATTSSFMSSVSLPENQSLAANSAKKSTISESFFRLICEVLGANIVKSGSKTFAVYSISVTDVNGHSWSVKRRYQHFGELHRRLKDFSEYNLHLPPKHFLSTGLDVFVIQERCKLLDQYLKNLFQLPTVSSSIEVWDFLSVDSQMYMFSDSLYIIDTLPVGCGTTPYNKEYQDITGPKDDPLSSRKENISDGSLISSSRIKGDQVSGGTGLKQKAQAFSLPKNPEDQFKATFQNSNNPQKNTVDKSMQSSGNLERNLNKEKQESLSDVTDNASDPAIPSEWVPPNLSVPILDLVDVILQLKDGGWIRRQAFWAAKQVLQLGMGDAFDDWLIEKIQVLRRGSVIASGIKRLEQILWPDGIFITKHPSRQRPSPGNPSQNSPGGSSPTSYSSPKAEDAQKLEEMQQRDAERRAKFVYELMIDNAPTAIVGLVGRREYEKCAKDLYYFIQSSVFLKQLAFDFLELLLSSAFPELGDVFKQFLLEKEKFGKPILSSEV